MNDIVEREQTAVAAVPSVTPMAMIQHAMQSGASMDQLKQLMDLSERWDRNEARKAFDAAMSSAKAGIPVIHKNREVDFTSSKGRTNYRYEDLAEIARTVDPILAQHGLSYRFRTSSPPNEPVTVTCIVAHRGGHSEENTLSAGRDESGNKNSIQAIGSTLTYLQRMTLKAALGLAASTDDDGKGASTKTSGMPEKQYVDFENAVDSAADDAGLESVWRLICTATAPDATNDKVSYDRLKERVKTRKAALAKKVPA